MNMRCDTVMSTVESRTSNRQLPDIPLYPTQPYDMLFTIYTLNKHASILMHCIPTPSTALCVSVSKFCL